MYFGVKLEYNCVFEIAKNYESIDYNHVYKCIAKINNFLHKENSPLMVIDSDNSNHPNTIILGYLIAGVDINKHESDSFSLPLPKYKSFEEFKLSADVLKDYLDLSKITTYFMLFIVINNVQ